MQNQKKFIIGYDVRITLKENQKNWVEKRKKEFLYKEEVRCPLSTDFYVWLRVFEPSPEELFFIGHQMLWTNLEALETYLGKNVNLSSENYTIIAVEIILNQKEQAEIKQWKETSSLVTPNVISEDWSFLGFDVSDRWLLSGLSNCGFLPNEEDVVALKNKWKDYLNSYHLFTDIEKAFEFTDVSNTRVPEHSPFFVFGLWLVN